MYHTGTEAILERLKFLNYHDGQEQLKLKRQAILFYANENNADNLSEALRPFLKMLKQKSFALAGLNHVVVVPCWDDWDLRTRQIFDECQAALGDMGRLNAVYSTAPPAQCRTKLVSSSSEGTVSDEMATSEQPFSQDLVPLRPHLVIGFSYGKRSRASDASENVPLTSQGSFSAAGAAAGGGGAAGLPASTIASPGSSVPTIQEQVNVKANCCRHCFRLTHRKICVSSTYVHLV